MEAGTPTPKPPTGEQPVAPETGAAAPAAPQTLEQQLDGIRAWIARVDRKLGIRTYALGAAVVLALAAGIVGVVLAIGAKDDSATKDEVSALSDEIQSVSDEAVASTKSDISALGTRLDALEAKLNSLSTSQRTSQSELDVAKSDIEELRNQITDLQRSANNAGASTPGATTTTTTTTTTGGNGTQK
jgi:polyhydroxyalkanoate synthesis regulator phasin